MDTALPQKFPFILDRNLAKANCTGNRVCTSCDTVVLVEGFHHVCAHTYLSPHDCAQTRLCPHMFITRHICAKTRLCPHMFVTRHIFAQTLLGPDMFVPRHICAQTHLCPDTFVPRHVIIVWSQSCLGRNVYACGQKHIWCPDML